MFVAAEVLQENIPELYANTTMEIDAFAMRNSAFRLPPSGNHQGRKQQSRCSPAERQLGDPQKVGQA